MAPKFGYADKAMFSFFTKEAPYGAAVTVNASNFMCLTDEKVQVKWPDEVTDDGDMVTGYESATTQEILQAGIEVTISTERARPSLVAAALAMTMGSVSSTQDGALAAYMHKCTPMANSSLLPSVNGIVSIAGDQRLIKGLVAKSLKISAAKKGYLNLELVLVGNGSRTTNADSFVTPQAESWLKARNIRAWLETGADISLSLTTPAQGAENISSATPDPLVTLLQSFEFSWENNPEMQLDNVGVDLGVRAKSAKLDLTYQDATYVTNYENQTVTAIEVNLDSGTIIANTGVYKWGMILIFPSVRIKSSPNPAGGDVGRHKQTLDLTICDDKTNPPVVGFAFDAEATYVA